MKNYYDKIIKDVDQALEQIEGYSHQIQVLGNVFADEKVE